jgi:hypothetical protein
MTWAEPTSVAIISVQDFTSSGTWSRPSGCTKVHVHITAGGGGARHGDAGGAKESDDVYGSGGDGGSAEEVIDVSSTASVTVTVGAGGTSPEHGSAGGAGGTSSFGSFCSAGGGVGGGNSGTSANGSGSGGNINRSGNLHGPSFGAGGDAVVSTAPGKAGYVYVVNYG